MQFTPQAFKQPTKRHVARRHFHQPHINSLKHISSFSLTLRSQVVSLGESHVVRKGAPKLWTPGTASEAIINFSSDAHLGCQRLAEGHKVDEEYDLFIAR